MKTIPDGAAAVARSAPPLNRVRRYPRKFAAGLLLSCACLGARGEGMAEKLDIARQLVEVVDYGAMYESARTQCETEDNALFNPAVMLENNPTSFRGITRQSGYWPEIEAAYRRNQRLACAYLSAGEFSQFMARQYAERASLDDLRTALAFYSTPAGQRLQKVTLDINAAYQAYASAAMQKAVLVADKQIRQEVSAIIARYLREPR